MIYLSGPITGQSNYVETFNQVADELKKRGFAVVNPANLFMVLDASASWEEFMSIDAELLRMCDYMIQLPGWEKSLGCQREYGMALERDMVVLKLEDLVKNG